MSIIYNQNKNIFTLHTKNTTYQMQVDKYGYLLHLYYGARNLSHRITGCAQPHKELCYCVVGAISLAIFNKK